MVLFRRKKQYKLPRFPPMLRSTFKAFAREVPVEEIPALRKLVRTALKGALTTAKENSHIDGKLARDLAKTCELLLDRYADASPAQRKLIVGAARYFAEDHDPLPEQIFAVGYDDDVQVINHVLEELGIEGHFLTRPG